MIVSFLGLLGLFPVVNSLLVSGQYLGEMIQFAVDFGGANLGISLRNPGSSGCDLSLGGFLVGGFNFFVFSPLLGEMIQFD